MTIALELIGLRKSFGPTEIIRGVDLQIKKDELHAIIGPNGAGKSTLYNLISGMYKVSDGSIILNGNDITNKEPYEINRMGLSRSFQVTNIFPKMSVFENVRNGLLYHAGCKYSFWRFVDRRRDVNILFGALSTGEEMSLNAPMKFCKVRDYTKSVMYR